MPRELELKYSSAEGRVPPLADLAEALAPLGLSVRPLAARRQLDVYYDDGSLGLQRHGLALRVRASAGAKVAAVKGRGDAVAGVHEREELEAPLAADGPERGEPAPQTGGAPGLEVAWPAAVAARVSPIVELAALAPRLEIETWRTPFALERRRGGAAVAELAFDEVVCRPPGGRGEGGLIDEAAFSEVEVEAAEGTTRAELLRVGEALEGLLPLVRGSASKLERAASLLEPFL